MRSIDEDRRRTLIGKRRWRWARSIQRIAVLILLCSECFAAGPRYVTGWPFFTGPAGFAVPWSNTSLLYFTDPGGLSSYVNHQAADALVASAAAVWNVPVASVTIAQGGVLAEHVSSANVYLGAVGGTSGMVYPADVASTNYAAIPIAVIYDADGSVTETLLGGGASDPSGCRQNAVTESVDRFDPAGYILHAVLVLNGRCTGPAPEQQMQMQYQLIRAFGRILGLAWSQTNDNVFTGTPAPTIQQAQNWPIMHPIDILCGAYTYQCLPQPFTLRPDDIASLASLYPITKNPPAGKQLTLAQAAQAHGAVRFPTGEGMGGVNVTFQRITGNTGPEGWQTASAVTGVYFRHQQPTPVAAQPTGVIDSAGTFTLGYQGGYAIGYIPVPPGASFYTLISATEPVNPLYTGNYAVGPYVSGSVAPSGSAMSANVVGAPVGSDAGVVLVPADAGSTCGNGSDGTAFLPVAADASGWWNGLLCAYGHSAWTSLPVKAGRSFTFEVTALDEQGYATTAKAMPVIGAWAATDSPSALPTLGSVVSPFNGLGLGTSTMTVSTTQATPMRLVVADQRGDGRPDFQYQARLLYADTIVPATLPLAGGNVTITGMGFRAGNVVRVNGVLASGVSWSSNSLVVTLPTMATVQATDGTAVDVVVSDLSTGGTSTMSGALTYTSAGSSPNVLKPVSIPPATSFMGDATSTPFAVQVFKSDGVTPLAGEAITFSGSVAGVANSVTFGACGRATCVVTSDSNGMASSPVTPLRTGTVNLKAADGAASVGATFTAMPKPGSMQLMTAPAGNVFTGTSASTAFAVKVLATDSTTPLSGSQVIFSTTAGAATFDACTATTCTVTTNSSGIASTGVTPTAAGPVTLQAAEGAVTQTAAFAAVDGTPILKLIGTPPTGGYIQTRTPASFAVGLYKADGVTPMAQQTIVFSVISSGGGPTGNLTFTVCGANPCKILTGSQGIVGGPLDLGTIPGTYTLQAAYGSVVQTIVVTVQARTPILRIVSIPSGNQLVGKVSPTPFTAQVLAFDGVTPLSGQQITLSGVAGVVQLGPCNLPSCVFTSDSKGNVTAPITPLGFGPITLQAVLLNILVSGQFTGVSNGDTMQLVSAPSGTVNSGQMAPTPFAVRVIGNGQSTPTPGKTVTFSATWGSAAFSACGGATCTVLTDASGVASTSVTPTSTGPVALLAADGAVTQQASLTAKATVDIAQLVSAPAGNVFVGDTPPVSFAVRVLLSDGVTPAVGVTVVMSFVTGGATGTLAACGNSFCYVVTDTNGIASTLLTPLTAGTVNLRASAPGNGAGATFTAVARPEVLRLVSAPPASVYLGAPATFTVQLVLASDGVTPVPGRNVTFTVTGGSLRISTCAGTYCTVTTDANGRASLTVTPIAAGPASLRAAYWTSVQTASLTGVANTETLLAISPALFVAASQVVPWTLAVSAAYDGAAPSGVSVAWTATGLTVAAPQSTTDDTGKAVMTASVGPLAAGASASATACAWTSVCAAFKAVSVAASAWQVAIVSGGSQSAFAGAPLQPMVVRIVDAANHPIAGAPVTVMQTVTQRTVACPRTGRCPSAPTLAVKTVQLTSDISGQLTVTPISHDGEPTTTNVAISSGTQGFATATLQRAP